MKSHTEHLSLNIPARMGFINITPKVEAALENSGIREGLCLVNAMHITMRSYAIKTRVTLT